MPPPANPKIYHIVHVDRLPSIIKEGCLWSDTEMRCRKLPGTAIGIDDIKKRRLANQVKCRSGLKVGDCVPFYFCPRSVMLYMLYEANHSQLNHRGGQDPIVHLESDLYDAVNWAEGNNRRWAFTDSNAGSECFKDFCDLTQLDKISWGAIRMKYWNKCKGEKQAEFLLEQSFPWSLVQHVGVHTEDIRKQAMLAIRSASHRPPVQRQPRWYY